MTLYSNIFNKCNQNLRYCLKMTSVTFMERIKENADSAKQTIIELKSELDVLNNTYNNLRAQQLKDENAKLLLVVEAARKRLIQYEVKNGVKQIAIPNQVASMSTDHVIKEQISQLADESQSEGIDSKPKKGKKVKETLPKPLELPIDVGRLDLRVAKIEDVQRHPDADTLYLLKINCGEDKPRTVCSGLVNNITLEELQHRSVVLLCNLKPVKMRGIFSEAMVMCACSSEKVEVLSPPPGSCPGDLVYCEGYTRQPDIPVMNPKKKIFETVAPDLHTNNVLEACYKEKPLSVPGKGKVLSQTLKNVAVK